jgi:oligoendopeptidase F
MDFTTFKVRCSAISKVMSNSRSNPTLTDKQEEKLNTYRDKLDAGGSLTPNQQAEMADLEIK